jgi:hypothetical protein
LSVECCFPAGNDDLAEADAADAQILQNQGARWRVDVVGEEFCGGVGHCVASIVYNGSSHTTATRSVNRKSVVIFILRQTPWLPNNEKIYLIHSGVDLLVKCRLGAAFR